MTELLYVLIAILLHHIYQTKVNLHLLALQEVATTHEISHVCCVVRDNENPAIFGYATTTAENTAQNLAHVYTTDSPVSKIKEFGFIVFIEIALII